MQDTIATQTHDPDESIASNEEFMPSPTAAHSHLNSYVPTNQLLELMQ